jgi:hypothetical protein
MKLGKTKVTMRLAQAVGATWVRQPWLEVVL